MSARKEAGFMQGVSHNFPGKVKAQTATNLLYRSRSVFKLCKINICKIEQLFSAKYAARTHLFTFGAGKIISVHNTISWKVKEHGKQS